MTSAKLKFIINTAIILNRTIEVASLAYIYTVFCFDYDEKKQGRVLTEMTLTEQHN